LAVVRQADAEHRIAGGGVELGGAADRSGNRIQCWRQQGEDLVGPCGRLHAAAGAHEQRVVEQVAQARQGRADGRLAEEQFFRGAGHTALMHQRFKHDQQVEVYTTQVVSIHRCASPKVGQG